MYDSNWLTLLNTTTFYQLVCCAKLGQHWQSGRFLQTLSCLFSEMHKNLLFHHFWPNMKIFLQLGLYLCCFSCFYNKGSVLLYFLSLYLYIYIYIDIKHDYITAEYSRTGVSCNQACRQEEKKFNILNRRRETKKTIKSISKVFF